MILTPTDFFSLSVRVACVLPKMGFQNFYKLLQGALRPLQDSNITKYSRSCFIAVT